MTRVIPETAEALDAAARLLADGEVVAIATETVYGLAGLAEDDAAVERIFSVKGRAQDNPLIVHVSSKEMAVRIARVTPDAEKLMDAFWPGPLTLVLEKRLPMLRATTGLDTVGVRMPDDHFLKKLIDRVGPLAAPSANRSGGPSPTTAQHVLADLDGKIPLVIDGDACRVGVESTVFDVAHVTILRPGAVSAEQLSRVIGRPVSMGGDAGRPRSPGMKYRHYSPKATVRVFERITQDDVPEKTMVISRERVDCEKWIHLEDAESLARNLYAYLRAADDAGLSFVLIEAVPERGIGGAVMDRLRKAADGKPL